MMENTNINLDILNDFMKVNIKNKEEIEEKQNIKVKTDEVIYIEPKEVLTDQQKRINDELSEIKEKQEKILEENQFLGKLPEILEQMKKLISEINKLNVDIDELINIQEDKIDNSFFLNEETRKVYGVDRKDLDYYVAVAPVATLNAYLIKIKIAELNQIRNKKMTEYLAYDQYIRDNWHELYNKELEYFDLTEQYFAKENEKVYVDVINKLKKTM